MAITLEPWASALLIVWAIIAVVLVATMWWEASDDPNELDPITAALTAAAALAWPLMLAGILAQAVHMRLEDRAEERGGRTPVAG